MPAKFKYAVLCNKHGTVLTPPYRHVTGMKEAVVSAPKGKKEKGCPICRRENNGN